LKKVLLFTCLIVAAVLGAAGLALYFSLPSVSHLKTQNPKTTALIEQRRHEAQRAGREFKLRQIWVSFEGIPQLLRESVRVSEDARFYEHEGIDYDEISAALKKDFEQGRFVRGASTITQQLAKNLYLSTDKTVGRKLKEFWLARRLEQDLSKTRIFHLYLNVIEFGPGIFGVEAAARHFFGKGVGQLNLEEIVRLTAVIPKPLVESPTRTTRWLKWKAGWILTTLRTTGHITQDQYALVSARFQP
jgi:monofunctional biosynthetic peptidoglycan transglycosylase